MSRVAASGRTMPSWLILLFVATLALGTDEFVISGILPSVAADLHVTVGQAGLLVTAFAIAFCVGSPVIAVVTDRIDKKRLLISGLLVFALANIALAAVDDLWAALTLRVIAGLAAAAVSPTAMAIAGGAAPDGKQGRYLAVATAGLTVALFTGVPVGALVGNLYSWRATFVLIGIIALIVAAASTKLAPSVPGAAEAGLASRLAPARDPYTLALVGAMFLCGAGGLMFYNYLGAIIATELGGTSATITGALLLIGTIGIGAVFFGGFLADKAGPRKARATVVAGHAIALVALGFHLVVHDRVTASFFVLIAIWSLFAWALSPAIQSSLMAIDPQRAMLALALGISGLYGGSAVGAAIGAYLIDNHSAATVLFTGAALVAVAWILTLPTVGSKIPAQATNSARHVA